MNVTGGGLASPAVGVGSTVILPAGATGTLSTIIPLGSTFTLVLGGMPSRTNPVNLQLVVFTDPTGFNFTVTTSANLTSDTVSGITPNGILLSVNIAAVTIPGQQTGTVTITVPDSQMHCASPVMVAGQSVCAVAVPFTIDVQPSFFLGESFHLGFYSMGSFGSYVFNYGSLSIGHINLGLLDFFPTTDESRGIYFLDDATKHVWYTNPSLVPFFYDFTLNAWLYFFVGTSFPAPRPFYNFGGPSAAPGYTTPGFIFL